MKKHIIWVLVIISIFHITSCTKDTGLPPLETQPVKMPDLMYSNNYNLNEIFSVTRNGHSAVIDIIVDFSACKRIEIMRNTTGIPRYRYVAATLPPNSKTFENTLPAASQFYFWVRVFPSKGKAVDFGPIRIEKDEKKIGSYRPIEERYPIGVTRTLNATTLLWSFPNQKYQKITIYRTTSKEQKGRKEILQTLEWKNEHVDRLPDPESDYWYWVEAILENGAIVYQGPLSAEGNVR
jgi:hypothetical protein